MFEVQVGDTVFLVGQDRPSVVTEVYGEVFAIEMPYFGITGRRTIADVAEVRRAGETVYTADFFNTFERAADQASLAFERRIRSGMVM